MLKGNPILRVVTVFILPYITLFSMYIQVNGEISPGGGFQAGAILASVMIGYILIFGATKFQSIVPIDALVISSVLGVLIYFSIGFLAILFGKNFLNYYALPISKNIAQQVGIAIIELGVGLTVSSVLVLLYVLFANCDN